MLKGKSIYLRPVQEKDLEFLYSAHIDIENRGSYYPLGVSSEPAFNKQFQENGYWGKDEGMLLIINAKGEIIGHIEFFKTVNYLDEIEIGYQLYGPQHSGKGAVSEALGLMVAYLFKRLKVNRIRLVIHPDNAASRRIAEKNGFTHEGAMRGAWYHDGRSQDVEVYALLKDEFMEGREN